MRPLDNTCVLVAEDERSVRMLLRVVFEAAGAQVLEAEDGQQALRLYDLHPDIDALCTDVNMPNLDGPGLVAALRAREPNLPIVACTALDLRGHASPLRALVDGHVQKPFSPADVVRAIGDAIDLRRRAQQEAVS
jgi:CheY-like chemotaxis protein